MPINLKDFKKTIPNVTDRINDVQKVVGGVVDEGNITQKLISAKDYIKKIANLRAAKQLEREALKDTGKFAGSAIPIVGNLTDAYISGDPSRAIPILREATPLDSQKEGLSSLDYKIEHPMNNEIPQITSSDLQKYSTENNISPEELENLKQSYIRRKQ